MQLIVDSTLTQLSGNLSDELVAQIRDALSYEDTNRLYLNRQAKMKGRRWSNQTKVYCYFKKTQSFYTGNTERVINVLKENNIPFQITRKYQKTLYDHNQTPPESYNQLRDYQKEAVCQAIQCMRGQIQLPTRSGKSVIIATLAEMLPGTKLITVPSKELLHQLREDIYQWTGIQPGIIGDTEYELKDVNVGIVKSILARLEDTPGFDTWVNNCNALIADECHTTAADSFIKMNQYLVKTTYRIGMSATLKREDNKEILIEAMTGPRRYRVTSEKLIEDGWLCKPHIFMIDVPEKYHDRSSYEKVKSPKAATVYKHAVVENDYRNELIVDTALELEELGIKPILILVKQIKHGETLQKLFKKRHKRKIKFIHGESSDRTAEVKAIISGDTDILISSKILTTGVNIKPLRALIYAVGEKSEINTIQSAGRPLTPYENKTWGMIVDFYDREQVYIKKQSGIRYKSYDKEYPGCVMRIGTDQFIEHVQNEILGVDKQLELIPDNST